MCTPTYLLIQLHTINVLRKLIVAILFFMLYVSYSIYDVTLGIANPDVFIPPVNCE